MDYSWDGNLHIIFIHIQSCYFEAYTTPLFCGHCKHTGHILLNT